MKGEEKTITTTLGVLFGPRPLYPMSPIRQSNRITPLYQWKVKKKQLPPPLVCFFGLRPLYPMSPTRQSNRITPNYKWKVKKKQLPPPLVCFFVSAHFIRCHRQDNQIELLPFISERWRKNNYHHPWCAFLSPPTLSDVTDKTIK